VYTIVLEDKNGSIILDMPIKVNNADEIFPPRVALNKESDIFVEYIFLFKRQRKSRTLYTTGDLFYPIFVITPQEFFKNMQIDKRVYNQNDEIVNLSRRLLTEVMEKKHGFTDEIEKDINLKALMEYIDFSKNIKFHVLYLNSKGLCYSVEFDNGIIVPVKYSIPDNIPDKYFANNKKRITHDPIAAYKSTMVHMKEFIMRFNTFVVDLSKKRGMTRSFAEESSVGSSHTLNKNELLISPIFPLIKMDKVILGPSDKILGFMSNGLRYYVSGVPSKKEFIIYMSKGYDARTDTDLSTLRLNYDPVKINKMIHNSSSASNDPSARTNPDLKDMSRIIYEKHLYQLFTSELMAHMDKERNTEMRRKILKVLSTENLRGKSESIQRTLEGLLLPEYPEDMMRIQELLGDYYVSHYDKKTLLSEFESLIYQFDRLSLMKLRDMSEGFYRLNVKQRRNALDKINAMISDMASKFIVNRQPKFSHAEKSKTETPEIVECRSNLGSSAPYCEKGKLLVSTEKLKKYVQIFSEEVVNPLHREYILSAIYISEVIDVYKFPKISGEELYVKFG
jgi:hypothetical protein